MADLTQQRRGALVGVMAAVTLLMRMELFGLMALGMLAFFLNSPPARQAESRSHPIG